jgi:hypothetical protein
MNDSEALIEKQLEGWADVVTRLFGIPRFTDHGFRHFDWVCELRKA